MCTVCCGKQVPLVHSKLGDDGMKVICAREWDVNFSPKIHLLSNFLDYYKMTSCMSRKCVKNSFLQDTAITW